MHAIIRLITSNCRCHIEVWHRGYMDRKELLDKVRDSRSRLEAALEQVGPAHFDEIVLYGRWTIKDLLAHIGWWEQSAADMMTSLLQGDTPSDRLEFSDVNTVNERTYRENRDRSFDEVRQSELASYTALLDLVERTPEDQLFDKGRFAWLDGHPLMTLVAWNTFDHYDEHLVELDAWLAQSH